MPRAEACKFISALQPSSLLELGEYEPRLRFRGGIRVEVNVATTSRLNPRKWRPNALSVELPVSPAWCQCACWRGCGQTEGPAQLSAHCARAPGLHRLSGRAPSQRPEQRQTLQRPLELLTQNCLKTNTCKFRVSINLKGSQGHRE